jgi:hypothetical protein
MLSEDRIRQIEDEATLRAKSLSNDSLRKEAVKITLEHNDAPPGDERTELGIMDRVYTLELGLRTLTRNDA